MGTNGAKNGDKGNLHDRIQAIAYAWDNLDAAIQVARDGGGIDVRGIKLINKGDSWLVMLQVEIDGERFVSFKDATSSGDIGKIIRVSLETPDWKPDKFAKLDKKPSLTL